MNKISIVFYGEVIKLYGLESAYVKWNEFLTNLYNSSEEIMSLEKMAKYGFIDNHGRFDLN